MKKLLSILIMVLMLMSPMMLIKAEAEETQEPKRVINVVYDDSGSMIQISGEKYDTWCQAKYSMEVFASMLGKNDTMNIYVMSDYMTGTGNPPKLTLSGSDGATANVKSVHEMLTNAQDTPFRSVEKAYYDLTTMEADEKWLVVLTDGEFNEYIGQSDRGKGAIDQYFSNKNDDIKVMFFGMGKNAAEISDNPEKNIYYEKAKNNNEILNKITGICTRIFNSHRLEVNTSKKKIEFDVPMAQLIVFAQGEKVEIGNLKSKSGEKIKYSNLVSVRYSEKASTSSTYDNPKIATNLVGKVATFAGDFDAGEYTIDVEGAETIEVYYKPNVAIAAYLKNADGEEVTNIAALESGEYTIDFGFVRAGSNEIVPESKLLGKVKYSAVVTNNGKVHDKTYSSGDKIDLEEGGLRIDATASFLDYNTVSTTLDYTIYKNKKIEFSLEENPKYKVTSKGIGEKPIVVHMTLDGREFSQEEWNQLDLPKATMGDKLKEENGIFRFLKFIRKTNTIYALKVEKSGDPGILHLYPTLEENKVKNGTYVGSEYEISAYTQSGQSVWSGKTAGKVKLQDTRGILDQHGGTLIRLGISIGIFWILLGYTPIFKKRFPKSMKGTPSIECKPLPFGRSYTTLGRFTKDSISVWLPFVPEKGTLIFVPFGTAGIPPMNLKVVDGRRMVITNTKSYAGNTQVSIDGESIPEDQKKLISKTPSMIIEVKTEVMRYSCTPRI